jgi:GNAT superfamily N-acetyltransferase
MTNIIPVDHLDKSQVKRFIHFPFHLYRNSPEWVPPLLKSAYNDFNPKKHHFYQHGEIQLFLAEQNGKVVGRLATMENRRFNEYLGKKTAFFGFYDVIEDLEVSQGLFQRAFDWSRARGLDRMIGPRGLNTSDNTGILVEGFEYRPAMWLPYNYPYYDPFIKEAGFSKVTEHLSGYAEANEQIPERLLRIAERIKKRRGFQVIHFESMKDRQYWIPQVWNVLLKAFSVFDEYVPPSEEEMEATAANLISIADPRLIKLVQKDGELIGFIFAYHDVTAAIQRIRGRLWPLGWLHLLLERKRTKWVNINGVGVLPEFQGMGVNAILYTEVKKSIDQFDFEHVDVVQVGEANFQSRSDMENMGIRWYKSHRSYQRDL